MLLYALLNASLLFLVTGQALQIEGDLERQHTVLYLDNFISDVGFSLAIRYVFGISCVLFGLAFISRGYRPSSPPKYQYSFAPSRLFYVSLFLLLILFSLVLIFFVVGLTEFLHSTRPGFQSGSTIFLVLLSIGSMPLLFKILYKGRIGTGDIACFLVSFIVTGIMGRLSAGFYLLIILLVFYYERGWANSPMTPRLMAKILSFGAAAFVIFMAYGAIRGAQAFASGTSLSDLIDFIQEHPEKSVLSLEWNYRFDIEGMSGTAGALTQYISNPNLVHYDYGASWILQGLVQCFPGFLKSYANSITDLSADLSWYSFSVVPTGVESFFMSFGWSAVLLFPFVVYLFAWRLTLLFLRLDLSPASKFAAYVIMTWTITLVRGPLITWIAFCISYTLIPLFFWPFFQRYFSKTAIGIPGSISELRETTA